MKFHFDLNRLAALAVRARKISQYVAPQLPLSFSESHTSVQNILLSIFSCSENIKNRQTKNLKQLVYVFVYHFKTHGYVEIIERYFNFIIIITLFIVHP